MNRLPETSVVALDRHGPFLFATLDDPDTRNALGVAMVADLEAVLAATREDRSLRALVLRGTEGRFCAGANLKGNIAGGGQSGAAGDPVLDESRRGGRMYAALNSHPMAVIALIDGPAMGGGMGLACCADIVITTDRARFALSETKLGLVPAQIARFVIARIGLAKARRLSLSGARFDGAEAAKLGLSDFHCGSLAEAEERLAQLLDDIRHCAPEANARTKRFLQECARLSPDELIEEAAQLFVTCLRGPEGIEGVAAFSEKRKAGWAEQA